MPCRSPSPQLAAAVRSANRSDSSKVSIRILVLVSISRIKVEPTHPFIIKADKDIRYKLIDEIIDTLRRAQAEDVILLTGQRTAG